MARTVKHQRFARQCYDDACRGAGINEGLARVIARLVGDTDEPTEVAERFKFEGNLLLDAARIAKERAHG